MPSSISSSNDRLPDGPWGFTWVLTLVLAIALAVGIESSWRSQGQRAPMVVDDKDNWCLQRDRLSTGDADTVALLGMSRIQLGFATQVFYDRHPHLSLGNLCVEGLAPFAALRDLAADESFKGLAIIEITEPGVMKALHENQQPYVEHHHRVWRFDRRIVRQTANIIQSNLVMVNPSLSVRELLVKGIEGKAVTPNYLITFADRSRLADFSKADMMKLWMFLGDILLGDRYARRDGIKPPPAPPVTGPPVDPAQQWLADIALFREQVKTIQARGGKVVFIRYPTSGGTQQVNDLAFPRDQYWDVFAANVGAPAIHCDDLPGAGGLPTPDWSHLGQDDARTFTAALLDELERRGLLKR